MVANGKVLTGCCCVWRAPTQGPMDIEARQVFARHIQHRLLRRSGAPCPCRARRSSWRTIASSRARRLQRQHGRRRLRWRPQHGVVLRPLGEVGRSDRRGRRSSQDAGPRKGEAVELQCLFLSQFLCFDRPESRVTELCSAGGRCPAAEEADGKRKRPPRVLRVAQCKGPARSNAKGIGWVRSGCKLTFTSSPSCRRRACAARLRQWQSARQRKPSGPSSL